MNHIDMKDYRKKRSREHFYSLIVAKDDLNRIGYKNQLLYNIPEDMDLLTQMFLDKGSLN